MQTADKEIVIIESKYKILLNKIKVLNDRISEFQEMTLNQKISRIQSTQGKLNLDQKKQLDLMEEVSAKNIKLIDQSLNLSNEQTLFQLKLEEFCDNYSRNEIQKEKKLNELKSLIEKIKNEFNEIDTSFKQLFVQYIAFTDYEENLKQYKQKLIDLSKLKENLEMEYTFKEDFIRDFSQVQFPNGQPYQESGNAEISNLVA
ncbi:UNKNOWN [Stylonychia lemnae]|uniref:Uncharacterized protein n=1 Tax=Stylonychia lemnae TaxID=5949 RepID=A0A078B525_STYLE|nr:UNKNOWN [Stylonychia lemnae]|eukprot:CDW88342.1 UNKNOWN [Stylonychia lemnae]